MDKIINKRFDEVFDLSLGRTPSRGVDSYWNGTHTWVSIADMSCGKYISESKEYITDKALVETNIPIVKKGTVIMSFKLSIGRVCIADTDLYTNEAIMAFVPKPQYKILSEYLYYYLMCYRWNNSNEVVLGFTLNKKTISQSIVSIPPLAEQERIVEILDREFEKIDALKANAERNLQYTKDLLKQSQNTVYNNIETNPLDSMVTIINGYAFKSEDFSKTNPIKAVKITNVGVGIFIETIDTNLPQNLLLDKQDYTVHTGDIVFALTRTIIAAGLKVAIVPETYNCALLNQRVAALRIDDDIQRKYLYNYFQTATVKEYVLKKVNTLMQPNLSIKDLKAMPIPYCDRAEMEQIVARLDKLKENCQALEENYKKTIALCDDMKQALLRQAFNGKL